MDRSDTILRRKRQRREGGRDLLLSDQEAPSPLAIAVAAKTIATMSAACMTLVRAKVGARVVSGTSPRRAAFRQRTSVIIGANSSRMIVMNSAIFSRKK